MFKIKELRKSCKESQNDLAVIVGVSLRTIQNYEAGTVSVPKDKLEIIAAHYDVSVAYLFDDVKKPKIPTYKKDGVAFNIKEIVAFIIENEDALKEDKQFNRYLTETGRAAIFKYFQDNNMIIKK